MTAAAAAAAAAGGGLLGSLLLGVIEGLTEFVPVSSTGHLIVAHAWLGGSDPAFEVAIQAGAITAILVRYGRDLLRTLRRPTASAAASATSHHLPPSLLLLIVVAALPAGVLALLFEAWIDAMFHPLVVATTLVLGGVLFLVVERWRERRAAAGTSMERPMAAMGAREAWIVGLWQVLSLVPGTSRSGASIIGGLAAGLSRPAAAEFSFLVGLPLLYGACLVKLAGDLQRFSGPMLPALLVASAAAFATALAVIGPFLRFLRRHSFRPFAYYRLAAGAAVFAMYAAGVLDTAK